MIEVYRREVFRMAAETEDELLLKQVYTLMYGRIYGRSKNNQS